MLHSEVGHLWQDLSVTNKYASLEILPPDLQQLPCKVNTHARVFLKCKEISPEHVASLNCFKGPHTISQSVAIFAGNSAPASLAIAVSANSAPRRGTRGCCLEA